jgi:uncharacterized glyoxalase superfamily protein PhnB
VADPLEVLRTPHAPVDPDPDFAARLRARVERALALPEGVAVTTSQEQPADTAVGIGASGVTPYLAVTDARAAIEWYVDALGGQAVGEPVVMPDGRIGHAELAIAGARVFLSDEHPEIGVVAPASGASAGVSLHLEVADVDAVTVRAAAAGAAVERQPSDNAHGRVGGIRDPFGHRWLLNSPPAGPASSISSPGREKEGDVVYLTMHVVDAARARAFYGAVFGWTFAPGHVEDGWQVDGPSPMTGLHGGHEQSMLVPMYRVDDIAAAVARVRAAGGTATDPERQPYGISAHCTDDQGTPFYLGQL